MVSLECLQFGDTCWLGPGPLKPHPCSPLEPPHFPGAPHFPHVTRRLFLWQVLDKIMLSDFIFFSPMYRFFSVAVTALVSPPTSLAPQGYSPPNVMEILVAHIYGALFTCQMLVQGSGFNNKIKSLKELSLMANY